MLTIKRNTFTAKEEPKNENKIITDNGRILYKICTLVIGTIPTASDVSIPTLWKKIKLKLSEHELNCFFSFDDEADEYEFCFICDSYFTQDILESKIFDYEINIIDSEVNMVLYINPATIESKTSSRDRRVIRSLMSRVFEIKNQSVDDELVQSARDINLNELFDKVISTREVTQHSDDYARCLQLRLQMNKRLYPYQEEAIAWMVKREQSKRYYAKTPLQAPRLYEPVALNNDFSIFYNPYKNHLTVQPESIPDLSTGGLLCDEMGLGKTVEVLGCILLHKRPKSKSINKNNRRILQSDSSSSDNSDEDMPLADRMKSLRSRPTIKRPPRARIPRLSKEEPLALPQPSKSRIPDKFTRPKKSATLQLLQLWYDGKLSSYDESAKQKRTVRHREIEISCACGISTEDTDGSVELVKCSECGIHQHAACFGYKTIAKRATVGYLCPACWKQQPLLKSGATLIVCPSRLLSQWQDEIRKHVRGELRVLIYEGGSRSCPVYPTELQRYDVVLSTYGVLQSDLVLTESSGKALRQRSRYCSPAAPIANINWWRLVLDEAQLVESPTLSVSKMAKLLSAKHRWAITGTPITRGLEDLLGIIDYLNMEPYSNPDIWHFKLMRPYLTDDEAPMLNFLAEVMWRTEKRHIKDQINIPKQTFELTWLDFSQIESYFYSREYEASKSLFIKKLDALNIAEQTPIHNLPVKTLSVILAPVLTLRHACSHFSAVKGRYLVTRKPLNSLQDLLGALVHKNSVDFEDNLRIAISAWNGMAGIHLLLDNPVQAIDQYKKILKLKENLQEPASTMKVEIDKLQVIHSLHNLIAILEENPKLLGSSDADNIDQLKEDHMRHEKLYIDKFDVEVLKAKKDFDEAGSVISTIAEEYDLDEIWDVYTTVDWIVENRMYDRFVKMLHNHPLMTDDRCIDRLNIGLHKELMSMLDQWETKLTNARDICVTAVVDLADCGSNGDVHIDVSTVEAAVQCHLRITSQVAVASGERRKCNVCETDMKLNDYEALLYNKQWKPSSASVSKVKSSGNWAPSSEEIALQCIARLGLQQPDCEKARRRGHAQKQLLDGMRKELKAVRALWMKISFSVNCRDELSNCRMRLELNPDAEGDISNENRRNRNNPVLRQLIDENDDRLERINFLNRNELDYQHARLNNEAELAVREYERLLGTNLYLSTLHGENARAGGEGHALDPCPICRSELGATFHMMPCGHCYCVNCTHALVQDAVRNTVPCAVCRLRHNLKDINYLKIKEVPKEPSSKDSIKGNCSTKLEAVIRLILRLREEETNVKVLIYSIWNTVLKILLQALHDNGVLAVHMTNDKQLDNFKDPTKNITALLLPISSGSKGLTLIEATHVIFLDPVLDPSDELQAISRVHRIGQTRPTVVHRFLMKDSIDLSIYNITNKNAAKSIGWKDITIAQLKGLYTHTSDI